MNNTKQSTALSKCCGKPFESDPLFNMACSPKNRREGDDIRCMNCYRRPCDISEGEGIELGFGTRQPKTTPSPSVQYEEMESTSEKIMKDIIEKTRFARKEAWDNNNVWGTHYSADVQFLLSRLTAIEARNKELELIASDDIYDKYEELSADKAKLLADWRLMECELKTISEFKGNRNDCLECHGSSAEYLAEEAKKVLSYISYTDSPTAHG